MAKHVVIFVGISLLAVIPCTAATITVDPNGSADYTTIQAGINATVSGQDTVIVAEGTYVENISFGGKNIVLRSIDPNDPAVVAATIIDGNDMDSVVTFDGTESNDCKISGFTITGGKKGMPLYVDLQAEGGDVEPGWKEWSCPSYTPNSITLSADFDEEFTATLGSYPECIDNGDWQTDYPPGPEIADVFEDGCRRYPGYVITLTFSNLNAGDYCIRTYHVDMSYPGPSPLATFNVLVNGQVVSVGNTVGRDSFLPKMEGTAYFTFTCDGVNDVVIEFDDPELDEVWLNGFILMGDGTLSGGAGIAGNGCAATINKCVITNNLAICGGGLCDCDGLIENNVICDNRAYRTPLILIPPSYGGGLYDCDGLIQNNIITENIAEYEGHGGGLYDCDGTIQYNIISNNSAYCGGGLKFCDGAIVNNLLVGNLAVDDGAIVDCNAIIGNCVVVDNRYGGIRNCSGTIKNCIIWGNSGAVSAQVSNSSTPTYSCIEDWTGGGIGNIDAAPDFVDPNNGDYHLRSQAGRWDPNSESWVIDDVTSPCIDAGNPNSEYSAEPWPNGHRVNMGAYGNTPEASRSCTNIDDVRLMGGDWLQADSVTDIIPYPNGDGIVDLRDYAFLTLHWLCQEY